jgi:hypothetical protein
MDQYPSVLSFHTSQRGVREKNVLLQRFIIFDMNRDDWEKQKKESTVQ